MAQLAGTKETLGSFGKLLNRRGLLGGSGSSVPLSVQRAIGFCYSFKSTGFQYVLQRALLRGQKHHGPLPGNEEERRMERLVYYHGNLETGSMRLYSGELYSMATKFEQDNRTIWLLPVSDIGVARHFEEVSDILGEDRSAPILTDCSKTVLRKHTDLIRADPTGTARKKIEKHCEFNLSYCFEPLPLACRGPFQIYTESDSMRFIDNNVWGIRADSPKLPFHIDHMPTDVEGVVSESLVKLQDTPDWKNAFICWDHKFEPEIKRQLLAEKWRKVDQKGLLVADMTYLMYMHFLWKWIRRARWILNLCMIVGAYKTIRWCWLKLMVDLPEYSPEDTQKQYREKVFEAVVKQEKRDEHRASY